MEKVSSTQFQPSPGVSKETVTDKYSTCREDIAEVAIAAIQPCPIIPDFKEPTASTLPIIAQTPDAHFCIDGRDLIEKAKAAGQATTRCHVYHIAHHSIIELAIRKVAIRIMPQGGKCSYAELVRNAHHLRQALESTSDDLALFTHGGDRRSVAFADSKQKNIVTVLTSRLGKSPTTISKYLQHSAGLNNVVMEELVNSGAPKTFFEAFQTKKDIRITALRAEEKSEAVIVAEMSNLVSAWWKESQLPAPPDKTPPEKPQPSQPGRATGPTRPTQRETRRATPTPRSPRNASDDDQDPPASDPTPTDAASLAAELKRIGEAIIEIADSQQSPTPQQVETIRMLIQELAVLHRRLVHPSEPELSGNGGSI